MSKEKRLELLSKDEIDYIKEWCFDWHMAVSSFYSDEE